MSYNVYVCEYNKLIIYLFKYVFIFFKIQIVGGDLLAAVTFGSLSYPGHNIWIMLIEHGSFI